jgi:hypothetical protein
MITFLVYLWVSVWVILWLDSIPSTQIKAPWDILGSVLFGATFSLVSRRRPRWYTFK